MDKRKKPNGTIRSDNGGITDKPVHFPSNSKKAKKEGKEKLNPVASGKKRKKTLADKFKETFIADDIDNISQYIIFDVITPAVKNMISDTINNGVDMLLFGQTKGSRTRRSGNSSYVSYNDRYRSSNHRTLSNRSRARHDFSDIIIDNRGDAEMVLSILVENLDRYEVVSVGDLYELVDITPTTTDYDYGWYDLRRAEVRRVRDGYILVLPRPSLLD